MKITFLSPKSSGFGAFDGIKRTCVQFKRVSGVKHAKRGSALRCKKFKKGRGHPVCPKGLVGGGRSPGLVRPRRCGGGFKVVGMKHRRKAHRKTHKRRYHKRKYGLKRNAKGRFVKRTHHRRRSYHRRRKPATAEAAHWSANY